MCRQNRRCCGDPAPKEWAAPSVFLDATPSYSPSIPQSGKYYRSRRTGVWTPSGPRPCVANQKNIGPPVSYKLKLNSTPSSHSPYDLPSRPSDSPLLILSLLGVRRRAFIFSSPLCAGRLPFFRVPVTLALPGVFLAFLSWPSGCLRTGAGAPSSFDSISYFDSFLSCYWLFAVSRSFLLAGSLCVSRSSVPQSNHLR